MSQFLQRMENAVKERHLLSRGQKILVAVSGGLDSMALLQLLHSLAQKNRWKISVAHFNHQLRGRASDADEKLVRAIAMKLSLPVFSERGDVAGFARRSKISVEMAARKLRHEFLARIARQQKIPVVALAHHADDQVEHFFLRVLRGAGGEGLAGMKWRSPSPAAPKIALVRPLLGFSKTELLEFVRENKIRFREDATNFSTDFLRNRIRNELLPLLQKNYQPGLSKSVLRLMEIIGAEAEFVGETACGWERRHPAGEERGKVTQHAGKMPALPGTAFGQLPVAIQRRVLQSRIAKLGVTPDFELVEQLRKSPGQFVSVGARLSVARTVTGKLICREHVEAEFKPDELRVSLQCLPEAEASLDRSAPVPGRSNAKFADGLKNFQPPGVSTLLRPGRAHSGARSVNSALGHSGRAGRAEFGGRQFRWQIQPQKKFVRPAPLAGSESFDADRVGGEIILRHWRAGDRFQPIGMKSPVKLQDLFVNARIPAMRRRELVLATTAGGDIFWVEDIRIGEKFKLTGKTRAKLAWKWTKKQV